MNRWILLALVVLVVAVFVLGQGLALSRAPVVEKPEKAPRWLGGGLAGLLRPFAAELDPADVEAQDGVGWSYDPARGRLSVAGGTVPGFVALRLPPDPEHEPQADTKPHQRSRRMVELTTAGAETGGVSVRLVDPLDPDAADFADLTDGRMHLAVPPEGGRLELRCVGPRSFLLQ